MKSQEPPVILHPIPPMYFTYFDQDLWSTIWHLSEYLPFSNQDKQFLRDVIKAAQIPDLELDLNKDERLSHPDVEQDAESDEDQPNQGPRVSTDNGGIQVEEQTDNSHIIKQVGGTFVNKPTTIGKPQEDPQGVERKGMKMGGNVFLNTPNRQITNQIIPGYPGYALAQPGTQWPGNTFANYPYGQTQGFLSPGNTFVNSVSGQLPNQIIPGYPGYTGYAWVPGVQPTGHTFINSPAIVKDRTLRKKGEFMDIPDFNNTFFNFGNNIATMNNSESADIPDVNKTTHDFGGIQHVFKNKGTSIIQHAGGTYNNMPTVIGTPNKNSGYYNAEPKGDIAFTNFDEDTNTKRTFISTGNTYTDSPVAINYRQLPETPTWNPSRSDFDSSEDDEVEVSMELSKEDDDYDAIDEVRNFNANNDETRIIQPEDLPPDVEIFSNSEINVDPISKPEKYRVEIINRTTNQFITNPTRSQYVVPKKYYSDYKKPAYPKVSNKNRVMCNKYLKAHPFNEPNRRVRYGNWLNMLNMHEPGSICQCMQEKSQAIKALPKYMSRMMAKPSNMDKNNVLEEQKNSQRFVDIPKYLSDFTDNDSAKKEYMKTTTEGMIKSYLYLKKKIELPHMQVEYNPAMAHIDGFVNH